MQPKCKHKPTLQAHGLTIQTPSGRPLFQELTLLLNNEKAAILGRNGVGKSTLLRVLAGLQQPQHGRVRYLGPRHYVPQRLDLNESTQHQRHLLNLRRTRDHHLLDHHLEQLGLSEKALLQESQELSDGQRRKLALLSAFLPQPRLLLLDEPTESLDEKGRIWLHQQIQVTTSGLLIASHDRRLLRQFQHFLLLSEAGSRYFQGNLHELDAFLLQEDAKQQKKYQRSLRELEEKEWHHARVSRRRARKKNLGRIHEAGRCPSRALLNTNRSYAQVSQGKAAIIRKQRQDTARQWTRAARRALEPKLALSLPQIQLPPNDGQFNIRLENVSHHFEKEPVFSSLSLTIQRERIAIQGPNGSGKTTLLRVMLGEISPTSGHAQRRHNTLGFLAQHAANWIREESLLELLALKKQTCCLETLAELLVKHQFPLQLAQRPLRSLSHGERVRAALLCLFERSPSMECLLLDEPTQGLDFIAYHAIQKNLAEWPGGLIIASHDDEFLQALDIEQIIQLPHT